jgi:hypothetical protein
MRRGPWAVNNPLYNDAPPAPMMPMLQGIAGAGGAFFYLKSA